MMNRNSSDLNISSFFPKEIRLTKMKVSHQKFIMLIIARGHSPWTFATWRFHSSSIGEQKGGEQPDENIYETSNLYVFIRFSDATAREYNTRPSALDRERRFPHLICRFGAAGSSDRRPRCIRKARRSAHKVWGHHRLPGWTRMEAWCVLGSYKGEEKRPRLRSIKRVEK